MSIEMKKVQLRKELDSIWKILTFSQQCYEYSHYLYSPRTIEETEYVDNNMFFDFTRHLIWRNLIIEIAKLTTDNKNTQKYNLFSFLNKLKNNVDYKVLNIKTESIIKWENQLKNKSQTIKEITLLRNKVYSHTDKDKSKYVKDSNLTFKEVRCLLDIIILIIFEIFNEVLDTHASIKPLHTINDNFKILEVLAENKKSKKQQYLDDFLSKANNKS